MEQITVYENQRRYLYPISAITRPRKATPSAISAISPGHNGTGKTTMAHGICYALYGVSYYGEQKIERLMNEKLPERRCSLTLPTKMGQRTP